MISNSLVFFKITSFVRQTLVPPLLPFLQDNIFIFGAWQFLQNRFCVARHILVRCQLSIAKALFECGKQPVVARAEIRTVGRVRQGHHFKFLEKVLRFSSGGMRWAIIVVENPRVSNIRPLPLQMFSKGAQYSHVVLCIDDCLRLRAGYIVLVNHALVIEESHKHDLINTFWFLALSPVHFLQFARGFLLFCRVCIVDPGLATGYHSFKKIGISR